MSASTAGHQAHVDLQSMLASDGRFRDGWDIEFGESVLHTKPLGTLYAGLCQREQLIIDYGPARKADRPNIRLPLRPRGLRVREQFRIIGDLRARQRPAGPFDGDCPGSSALGDEGWFDADNVDTAASGYLAIGDAIAELQRRSTKPLTCASDVRDCYALFLKTTDQHNIKAVVNCRAKHPDRCYEIWSPTHVATIRLKYIDNRYSFEIDVSGINFVI